MVRHIVTTFVGLTALIVAGSCASGWGSGIGLGGKDVRKELSWIEGKEKVNKQAKFSSGDYGRKIKFESKKRFYEVHIPKGYTPSIAYPVVINLHGGGGYPSGAAYQSGFDRLADRENFIALYPAGTGKLFNDRLLVWNDGRDYKGNSGIKTDSVGFISKVLDDLASLVHIDPTRVYCTGMSNGAQMCYRLAKQLSERIAAIAVVAGHRPAKGIFPPPPRPMPVMQISGVDDPYAPYRGGLASGGKGIFKNKFQTKVEAVMDTVMSWVKFNQCKYDKPTVKRVGKAVETRYSSCQGDAEVVLWTLEDGGHTWPKGEVFPAEIKAGVGPMNKDISATEEIWKFFKRHRIN